MKQPDGSTECVACGIVFRKFHAATTRNPTAHTPSPPSTGEHSQTDGLLAKVRGIVFHVDLDLNPFYFGGRLLVFLGLTAWSVVLISKPMATNYIGGSFMHLINLPFHEAGHIAFGLFGRFIGAFGGTLGQLLIPIVCLLAFLLKRNTFAASVGLWWSGVSMMDIAPYINDARAGSLVLLGGTTGGESPDFHDWRVILGSLDWLQYDHALAMAAHWLGTAVVISACAWGGCILILQYRKIDLS